MRMAQVSHFQNSNLHKDITHNKKENEIKIVNNLSWFIKISMEEIQWEDNGKPKLLIIVGTRPEIIRLAAVMNKCRKYFDTILAHTGQNYDLQPERCIL